MIVRNDDATRPVPNRLGKNLPGVLLGSVGKALRHHMNPQEPITVT